MDERNDDDDEVDVDLPLGGPVHPDDRLWRHPSELAAAGPTTATSPARAAGPDRGPAGRWLPVVLAGTVGALLAAGLLSLTGDVDGDTSGSGSVGTSSSVPISVTSPVSPIADLAERLEPSLFAVSGTTADGRVSRGSAVAIRPDHVLTAARLVVDSTELQVLVRGLGRRATLVGSDPDTDLAVLAVDGGGMVPAPWGESADLRPGDAAVAVSRPPASEPGPTVTAGVVSGLARTLAYGSAELRGLLQVDRPVPPEGAGGALLDPTGALVGITLPAGTATAPFGYAVPAEVAKDVARQLLARGKVSHPWLGVEGTDRGMNGGAAVQRVKAGSPAAKVGVLEGDVITEMNGVATPTMSVLLMELRERQPGDIVRLVVVRASRIHEVFVTLIERP